MSKKSNWKDRRIELINRKWKGHILSEREIEEFDRLQARAVAEYESSREEKYETTDMLC